MPAKTTIGLSFDDGYLAQFKWARGAFRWNVPATFYINPCVINQAGWLQERMLKQMSEEWGHSIANHTWNHESPRACRARGCSPTPFGEIVDSAERTRDWLDARGWTEASSWVALPYGQRGGQWTPKALETMRAAGFTVLRDVLFLGEEPESRELPSALEDTDTPLVEGKCNLYYFHHDFNTWDHEYEMLLNRIEAAVLDGTATVTKPPEWR